MSQELKKRIYSSLLLIPTTVLIIIYGSYFFIFLLMLCLIISFYEWHLLSKNRPYYLTGFLLLILSFYCAYKIRFNSDNELFTFLFIISICIFTDIGGYIFGKLIKGPKLTKYSPNKTYAGAFGGYFLSMLFALIIYFSNLFDIKNLFSLVIISFLFSTVSQLGDITISYFKRISKVKDTGKIIPGHGGLLDRIDGMIFVFPFAYLTILYNFFGKF